MKNLSAIIESLLFIYGAPLTFTKLAKITKANEAEIKTALEELTTNLQDRGLSLITTNDTVQLVTNPDFSSYTDQLIKDDFDESLTPAALETLTIVNYLSPVSRAQVDLIRGVNSAFILRALLLRGLITRHPDPQRRYVYLYEPTPNLLQYLGISNISELPDYEKYHGLLNIDEVEESNENK